MSTYGYIAIMAVTTYLIRMIPLTVFRKKIKNRFISSFLYYIPCVCLTAMTFPAILEATSSVYSALFGLLTAFILAYKEKSLVTVSAFGCLAVFAFEMLLTLI